MTESAPRTTRPCRPPLDTFSTSKVPAPAAETTAACLRIRVRCFVLGVVTAVAAAVPVSAAAQEKSDLTGKDIQALVRYSHSLQDIELKGLLRTDSDRVPFLLTIRDSAVSFTFTNPDERITLQQLPDGYSLRQWINGDEGDVPKDRYKDPVRGTNVLFEDLSMRFLYWEQARLIGDETIRNRAAWKVHIPNTDGAGPYSQVYIWVDQISGGLMKMEAFDWTPDGAKRIKMYQVVSGQKIRDTWVLKKMNVETYDSRSGKLTGRTSLELRE